jgi:hypothetical protein
MLTDLLSEWIPLTLNGQQRGEVFLNLTFFPTLAAAAASPSSPLPRPSELAPYVAPASPAPKPEVPSALNSLLWRHGIPLRIPSLNINFKFLVRRPKAVPEWVRPGEGGGGGVTSVFAPSTWVVSVGNVMGSFKSVFAWTWAGGAKD